MTGLSALAYLVAWALFPFVLVLLGVAACEITRRLSPTRPDPPCLACETEALSYDVDGWLCDEHWLAVLRGEAG